MHVLVRSPDLVCPIMMRLSVSEHRRMSFVESVLKRAHQVEKAVGLPDNALWRVP